MSDIEPTSQDQPRWPRTRRFLMTGKRRWVVAVVLVGSVTGVSLDLATSSSPAATTGQVAPAAGGFGGARSGGAGSNARSGPAAGGSVGTVASMSASGFTLTTAAGQKVTIDEASATTYKDGADSVTASSIATGEPVLVLGTTSGTTISATQIIVQPSGGPAPASASAVVAFKRGAPATSKQVGQVPADYSEGSGTIVGGSAANQATEAALIAYPGGVVDRVVKLSNGEYEVHNIGVNWPHHVFVTADFTVVGAD